MLFITPDFLTPNNHYSFSFKPCYYSLFSFHPKHLIKSVKQLITHQLPIDYSLLISLMSLMSSISFVKSSVW